MMLALLLLTFRDVQPILQKHCVSCHQPGEIAPMPFLTYEQVRPWAKAIREAVLSKKMPPWFAAEGHFANDPSLTKEELQTIAEWVNAGAQRGGAAIATSPISKPQSDFTVSMSKPFAVSPGDVVPYQYFTLKAGFAEDKWIGAVDIRPSERSLVHHAVLYVREKGEQWNERYADILAVYTPGQQEQHFPHGMAKKLPAGADLVLQLHYTAGKKPLQDQTSVGLSFTSKPEKRLLTLQMNNITFRIPPRDRDYQARAFGTLPHDVELVSMFPHMHLRGSAFEYQISEPGGHYETLLKVKPYDFYWQLQYVLDKPRLLKKGTRLIWTAHWDNSPNNPRNPDPNEEVTWGEQSWQEMMVGFFDVAVDPSLDKHAFLM